MKKLFGKRPEQKRSWQDKPAEYIRDVSGRAVAPVEEPQRYRAGDLIKTRQGSYEVHDYHTGGLGVVYICYDKQAYRFVAVKGFKEQYALSIEVVRRFLEEAYEWTRLERHQNIVEAYFVELIEERPCIFIEYVAGVDDIGHDLTGWIEHQRLDLEKTLKLATEIANGMHYAYEKRRLIHCDLKPANVLITGDGEAKVTDFGLAKAIQAIELHEAERRLESTANANHLIVPRGTGTPSYMAPEQFPEELLRRCGYPAPPITTRADIFSFGLVLYEMLTGTSVSNIDFREKAHELRAKADDVYAKLRWEIKGYNDAHAPLPPHLSKLAEWSSQDRCYHLKWNSQDISYPLMWHSLTPELLSCNKHLDDIMIKCLRIDPEERYNDFKELRDELAESYRSITGKEIELELEPGKLDARRLVNIGVSLARLGKTEEALSYYDQAIELAPFEARTWADKASSLSRLGRHEEALSCCDRATELEAEDCETWTNKGNTLDELGRSEEALSCYDRAIKIDPKDAISWRNKGVTLGRLGRNKEALRCYDRTIEIDPKFAKAWTNKGISLGELGRHEEALNCYDKAVEINPWYAEAWMCKGGCLSGLGRHDEALRCYNKAIEIEPDRARAWLGRGGVLTLLGREEDAVVCFDRAIETDPELIDARLAKGAALAQLGRPTEALACYDQAIKMDDRQWKAWSGKAVLLVSLGKYNEALGCCEKALKINPSCVEALIPLGVALMNLGRLDEAMECYDEALRINPQNAEVWVNKAICSGNMGKPRDALKCSDEALKIEGELFEGLKCKGAALVELERYDEAIEYCRRAIKLAPDDPEVYFNLGKALGLKGRHAEALAAYEKFIELASPKSEYDETVKIAKRIVSQLKSLGDDQELLEKAIELNNQDRYSEAIKYCDRALAINPVRDATWDEKAFAIWASGNLNEALECCNSALALNPNFVRVWSTRGLILAELGRREEAIESFQKYIQLAPREYASVVEQTKEHIRRLQAGLWKTKRR